MTSVQFSSVALAYLVIGAVMWGGGVIPWDDAGLVGVFVDDPEEGDMNQSIVEELEDSQGPIQEVATSLGGGGGLLAILGVVFKLMGYIFWPIVVLEELNAPPRVVAVAAVPLVGIFMFTFINLLRGSF